MSSVQANVVAGLPLSDKEALVLIELISGVEPFSRVPIVVLRPMAASPLVSVVASGIHLQVGADGHRIVMRLAGALTPLRIFHNAPVILTTLQGCYHKTVVPSERRQVA